MKTKIKKIFIVQIEVEAKNIKEALLLFKKGKVTSIQDIGDIKKVGFQNG